jgi:hypothetical protein
MRKTGWILFSATILGVLLGSSYFLFAQEIKKEDCIFLSSLHYTSGGMGYWYDKANGGLETITGVPYSQLICKDCHISSCDVCHKKEETGGKFSYSTQTAKNQEICIKCHSREASVMKIDQTENNLDPHFGSGMHCLDCHTAREMHGDGIEYHAMKQPGAMDAKCENCHESISPSKSHTVHGDKLDCSACHVRQVVSCTNCHFGTLVKEKKRVAKPVSGWTFLMNYNGKVASANMQSFVVPGDKTFLMFAPQFSHSVLKDGRKCEECHASKNLKQVEKGKVKLTWLKDGKVENLKGVIPVTEGVQWDLVYHNYENGQWIPVKKPTPPRLHYASFGEPLTKEQMKKMALPMGKK